MEDVKVGFGDAALKKVGSPGHLTTPGDHQTKNIFTIKRFPTQ
jgi:hypothetical protein